MSQTFGSETQPMNWIKWCSILEGKDIHHEVGEGYFLLSGKQSRLNWLGLCIGIVLAAISFTMTGIMAGFSPPEPTGFWFFLLFGIIALVFTFGISLLTYLRKSEATCLVSDGKITWNDESGLPKRFDHHGEIEIALIKSVTVAEWNDGSIQGIEFDLGDESTMIGGSLGPALYEWWFDEFMDVIHYWNPGAVGSVKLNNQAEQGGDLLSSITSRVHAD